MFHLAFSSVFVFVSHRCLSFFFSPSRVLSRSLVFSCVSFSIAASRFLRLSHVYLRFLLFSLAFVSHYFTASRLLLSLCVSFPVVFADCPGLLSLSLAFLLVSRVFSLVFSRRVSRFLLISIGSPHVYLRVLLFSAVFESHSFADSH